VCRFVRRMKRNPNYPVLVTLLSIGAFALGAALMVLLDWLSGSPQLRWGFTVWGAFVTGFTFAAVFNVGVGLLGVLCGEE
jgi:CHASE2 domain-containing sensor protein